MDTKKQAGGIPADETEGGENAKPEWKTPKVTEISIVEDTRHQTGSGGDGTATTSATA